jgi:hypothetical protein
MAYRKTSPSQCQTDVGTLYIALTVRFIVGIDHADAITCIHRSSIIIHSDHVVRIIYVISCKDIIALFFRIGQ